MNKSTLAAISAFLLVLFISFCFGNDLTIRDTNTGYTMLIAFLLAIFIKLELYSSI